MDIVASCLEFRDAITLPILRKGCESRSEDCDMQMFS